jgi:hypothetical protein
MDSTTSAMRSPTVSSSARGGCSYGAEYAGAGEPAGLIGPVALSGPVELRGPVELKGLVGLSGSGWAYAPSYEACGAPP